MEQALRNRRKFIHVWDEIEYLYWKIRYWLHMRSRRSGAKPFVIRLRKLLLLHDPQHEALLGVRCWAVPAEYELNLPEEIRFTKKGVDQLILLLGELWPDMPDYDWEDVRNELEILALLYAEDDQEEAAMKVLCQCRDICRERGIPFDEDDLRNRVLA